MSVESKYYRHTPTVNLDRKWPSSSLNAAPEWCSVDLRDGNQALPVPMNQSSKTEYFQMLCRLGFEQVEVGFPSASDIEYEFVRGLVVNGLIPDNVVPQVLTPCRHALIKRTIESLAGMSKAIVHLYCSTSPTQRKIVFGMSKDEVKRTILMSVNDVVEMCGSSDCKISLEFSPEHFNQTELEYSLEICEAVAELWLPRRYGRLILNLPATVECCSPNQFADQVEWMHEHLSCRNEVALSVHTHNDRGCAVAATELALLAGADRVEGTLFGNGERTGNADLITLAGNLLSQGINPHIELGNISELRENYQKLTGMAVGERSPYVGELVFTAFSGTHQDAISKSIKESRKGDKWDVPYLLVDPADFGRAYEPVVRINSQSGKGGLDFVLRAEYGIAMPKAMLDHFLDKVKKLSADIGEIAPEKMFNLFYEQYCDNQSVLRLSPAYGYIEITDTDAIAETKIIINTLERSIEMICMEIFQALELNLEVSFCESQSENEIKHAIYAEVVNKQTSQKAYGACITGGFSVAKLMALVNAVNNLISPPD